MMNPPDALRARILAAAAARPSPTRAQGKRAALVTLVVAVVVAGLVFQLAGGLQHSAMRPLSTTVTIAAGWTLFSALLTWLVLGRGRSTLARRPRLVAAAALVAPLTMFLWLVAFHGTYPETIHKLGLRCLGYTLVMAITPLAAFMRFRRGVEPRLPSALGAGAGAACGAWAGVVVDLWCPLTAPSHVLVGHVLPLVVLVLVGAALGARFLGVRAGSQSRG